MIEGIMAGAQALLNPVVLAVLFAGVFIGLTVGAIPGINDSIAIAVLIPVTFGMNPFVALALLVGIYTASASGGSIPAILVEIPGTVSAMMTSTDGYPMMKKGKGGLALSIAMQSSFVGGISSAIVLLFFAPLLAQQALRIGPPEYFMLAVLGLSTVIGMASNNISKNLISMAFGLWLSTIGMSPQAGTARFTFGTYTLLDGIPLIPRMIGLFGVTSVLKIAESLKGVGNIESMPAVDKVKFLDWPMVKRLTPTWIRSSIIGNIIGIIPGAGMSMATFISYNEAARVNKKMQFGTGIPEGIAAPESANNAVVASSMVPLLSLGIPGNNTSALFIGALMIQGIRVGPTLFQDNPSMSYMIILGFIAANLIMFPMSLIYCNIFARPVLKLKQEILSGIILVLCLTGAFAISNNLFHVGIAVVFGLVGYLFHKFKIPQSPLILASILGTMMESNWIQSMVFGNNSLSIFVTRPISLFLIFASAFCFGMPLLRKYKEKKSAGTAA
ncbi:MAG: C4-dicarboxylate ABC transporter [Lentisphaerae bacterium GWF2_52_8]|nr:MAG: C4-dicarboxylate ABC transporter [Lentisphaerae bacterium GWF2_52_8]